MDALVMCGGAGSRLDADVEKPLYEVCGRPMVDRVRDALAASQVDTVYGVTSPNAPRTRDHVEAAVAGTPSDESIIETPGDGYVSDLQFALEHVELPVLTVAADLPLLDGEAVNAVLARFDGPSLTVCVPPTVKQSLGLSVDSTMESNGSTVVPAGINVVSRESSEQQMLTSDTRYAVNVNRISDAIAAESILDEIATNSDESVLHRTEHPGGDSS